MGYNTDWYGQLKTNRAFTKKELAEWDELTNTRHDSKYVMGDEKREFPSIWCGFEIINYNDDSGTYGVYRWMGHEKTYQGKEWTIFFLKKLLNWSKTEDIYAEGEIEWRGDDGDNDMGRVIVKRHYKKMMKMHIETVDFNYKRDKTEYIKNV